ncbi:MAG TPA: hypothetical protein VFX70_21940 [Mycobacteriales bacterium]|nr:hypothetical protein [Mycobacteriales bacterium]
MSADTASPSRGGVGVVGDRYRLVERISADGTTEFWRAHDELLARPVALTVHTPGGDAARDFLAQAHRLSTLTHPAVARVYDAVDEGRRAYVVSEWVEGTPLSDVLAEEALDPNDAAALVGRVAEAVVQAHAAGLAFGDLHPDRIHFSRRGTVFSRIATGQSGPADDIRGLGALLYAALTGQWPLRQEAGRGRLRPAGLVGGRLSTPRQVRAGVPHDLSTLAMRALDPEDPRGIRSAEAVVTVLNDRRPPGNYEEPYEQVPFGAQGDPAGYQPYPQAQQYPEAEPYQYERPDPYQRRYQTYQNYDEPEQRRSRWVTVTAISAGVLALALVGWLIGSVVSHVPSDSGGRAQHPLNLNNTPTQPSQSPTSSAVTGTALNPAGAQLFDPEGDGQDNPEDVGNAIDGDPATSWSTVDYKHHATFGNLKQGMGIIVDLGQPDAVHQVTIRSTTPGADVEIRAGDTPTGPADSYQVVGPSTTLSGSTATIPISGSGQHRYWVVWITKLAPDTGATFHATLAEVQFRQ